MNMPLLPWEMVCAEECARTGFAMSDIRGPLRGKFLLEARRVIALRLHAELGMSVRRVARIINRHHCSVLNLVDEDFAEKRSARGRAWYARKKVAS